MARIIKESIDRFYDYGLYTETRTIYIGSILADPHGGGESGTDSSMAEYAIKALHILDMAAPNGDKPITILMNNPGGDVYHGQAIYDAVQACNNHVTIVGFGHLMSMGSLIFQAADKRIMSKNCKLMIHYGSISAPSVSPKTFYSWAEESKKIGKWMEEIYLEKIREKNPDYSRLEIEKALDFDTFINAEECLHLGLTDEILVRNIK